MIVQKPRSIILHIILQKILYEIHNKNVQNDTPKFSHDTICISFWKD